ncbi:MAG: alpha/beta hydrolase-fold protein [Thermoguttaceae bacterium]|jgi:phospholipase/carboxylesterase
MSFRRQSLEIFYQPPIQSNFEIESGRFSTDARDTVHSLFVPEKYTPGYGYPLIVWLHGPGSDERQLMRIMPLVSLRNFVAIAPRGTLFATSAAENSDSMKKGPPQAEVYGWSPSAERLQQAEERIFDCIDLAGRRLHIHPRRVFLAGFDCGGTMAFQVALNHPDRFAGILSLGGEFPKGAVGRAPLSRLPEARRLSIFLAAGRRSPVYGEIDVCGDLRLLHSAGLSTTLRLYPDGHDLTGQMLADVNRWIMDLILSPSSRGGSSRETRQEAEEGQAERF